MEKGERLEEFRSFRTFKRQKQRRKQRSEQGSKKKEATKDKMLKLRIIYERKFQMRN